MSHRLHISAAGFTLIEIVTVVTVLAILVTLALPSVANQADLNASAASRIVVSDLLYAQSQAIATQTSQYVRFTVASLNGNWGTYGLYPNAALTMPITDPVTLQPYTQSFGAGASGPLASVALTNIALDSPANTVLVFDELGRPYVMAINGMPVALAATGTIALQCGSMTVTISIEPSTGNLTVSP